MRTVTYRIPSMQQSTPPYSAFTSSFASSFDSSFTGLIGSFLGLTCEPPGASDLPKFFFKLLSNDVLIFFSPPTVGSSAVTTLAGY